MRVVRIEVDYHLYLWSISGHSMCEVVSDLPPDARVLEVHAEPDRRLVVLTVESATFADVPQLSVIPNWTPTMTTKTTELMALADILSSRHEDLENGTCPNCGNALADHRCPA